MVFKVPVKDFPRSIIDEFSWTNEQIPSEYKPLQRKQNGAPPDPSTAGDAKEVYDGVTVNGYLLALLTPDVATLSPTTRDRDISTLSTLFPRIRDCDEKKRI